MTTSLEAFDLNHAEAFVLQGAINPGQGWSAFDVKRPLARKGGASVFVTTIWSYHSEGDGYPRERLAPAISKNESDGTLWYWFEPPPSGARKTHIAHWEGIKLAIKQHVSIVGVFKDVSTGKCSSVDVFDGADHIIDPGSGAVWLQIVPRSRRHYETQPFYMDRNSYRLREDVLEDVERAFHLNVQQRIEEDSETLRKRIAVAPRMPERRQVLATVFVRNPDVVAFVLKRARGVCEGCRNTAPFIRRSDGSPYLEVHYRVRLARGGGDTVENALALCPNCHRKEHFA